MIENVRKFVRGYVRILVKSRNYDRFMNICAVRGLYLWEVEPKSQGYEMNISIRDFKELRPLARKCGAHISIQRKVGIPFILYANRHRKFLAAGFLLGTAAMFFLSMFIWNIEITGNQMETSEAVFQYLKEEKIYFGSWKNTVDCKVLSAELRKEFDSFTWVSAKMKGTSLIIEVKENETKSLMETTELPVSDLVADCGGVITEIITRSGVPLVKAGDRVEKGDILVSAEVPIYNDAGEVTGYHYCAADADIRIKTVYTYYDSFPLEYQERVYTGEMKKGFYIKAVSEVLEWKPDSGRYKEYDQLIREYQLGFSRYFKLPVYFGEIQIREYVTETKIYQPEEAKMRMQQNFLKNLEKIQEKGVQIFENNVKIEEDGQNCTANGCLTLIRDTGKRVERMTLDR